MALIPLIIIVMRRSHLSAHLALMAVALFAMMSSLAHAQDIVGKVYQQSPQVLARYPDIDIAMVSPGLTIAPGTSTTQAAMEAFIADLVGASGSRDHLGHLNLGVTPGGRNLPALLLSKEGAQSPAELLALGRPIVWLIGQQHGNEPAGGEAMLALAHALASGELTGLLDTLSVVIIPRANPDGAAAQVRETTAGFDMNRDHALLTQPETRWLHALVRQLPPSLVIDAHEFAIGRRWVERLGGLQAVDLMVLSATHPMTPEPVRQLAETIFQPAIEAAIQRQGLTSFVYHTMSSRAGDRQISVGGNAPGIARNAFGLMGAVSFLLETRGVGIGMDGYQRRIATHYIATRALLEAAAANAGRLGAIASDVRTGDLSALPDVVVAHTVGHTLTYLPLIDATSGGDRTASISMLDTRVITGTTQRARPAGYIISAADVAGLHVPLALLGARSCALSHAIVLDTERYDIISRASADARAINPEATLTVRVSAVRQMIEAGSIFVPVDAATGIRLMLALEPDAPGSLSAHSSVLDDANNGLALFRVPVSAMTAEFAARLTCTPQ